MIDLDNLDDTAKTSMLTTLYLFLGKTFLAFKIENIAMVNVGLVLIWIILGALIFKEHKRLSAQQPESA